MIKRLAVLSTDRINRYNMQFTLESLEDALLQGCSKGVSQCIGHDLHRPIGRMVPIGLFFEPGMCRLIGKSLIAETREEQEHVENMHRHYVQEMYEEQCSNYRKPLKLLLSDCLSEGADCIMANCVAYIEEGILFRKFPEIENKLDKDGLILVQELLTEFEYLGQGVFKHANTGIAVYAHRFFRRSLSVHNNLNSFFLDEFLENFKEPGVVAKIRLDPDMLGLASSYVKSIELEYWYGPNFSDDITEIKTGVTSHGSSEYEEFFTGVGRTEFWWKKDKDGNHVFEAEEVRKKESLGLGLDRYGSRYVHSIYDPRDAAFNHFDGAIRAYDFESMINRDDVNIAKAGKNAEYTKLFRIDGKLSLEAWKSLICHYYQGNTSPQEYFGEKIDLRANIIESTEESNIIDKYAPCSMNAGDGVRMNLAYSPIIKTNENLGDRYVSRGVPIEINSQRIEYVEIETIELQKALRRRGAELLLKESLSVCYYEDLYFNLPTIIHKGPSVQKDLDITLAALRDLFQACSMKGKDNIAAFSLEWDVNTDIRATLSVFGHSHDLAKWLCENNSIPTERELLRSWLLEQRDFLSSYPENVDRPNIGELLNLGNTIFIERRFLDPSIRHEIKSGKQGLEIAMQFPKSFEVLAEAYQEGELDVVSFYRYEKSVCDECGRDYSACEHSVLLDNSVLCLMNECELLGIAWTDRKA